METIEKECETCRGSGIVSLYRGCNQLPSNCCGGCEDDIDCPDCFGYGIIEVEVDEEEE